jgi:hypothetical protein
LQERSLSAEDGGEGVNQNFLGFTGSTGESKVRENNNEHEA